LDNRLFFSATQRNRDCIGDVLSRIIKKGSVLEIGSGSGEHGVVFQKRFPEIICEPGRALVAESGSTVVRVNLRKKQKLYINDGTYGTLFDAGTPNIVFPS